MKAGRYAARTLRELHSQMMNKYRGKIPFPEGL